MDEPVLVQIVGAPVCAKGQPTTWRNAAGLSQPNCVAGSATACASSTMTCSTRIARRYQKTRNSHWCSWTAAS